jgi:hypothetical protein
MTRGRPARAAAANDGAASGAPPRSAAPAAPAPPAIAALGGKRGLLDGALPPVVFVVVHALAGSHTTRPIALAATVAAAAATGLSIVLLRLLRKQTLRQPLAGLGGLTIAVLFAATTGEARGFVLPGIYVDAAYAIVFAGSAVIGRPLVGTIYGLLYQQTQWRDNPRLRRLFTLATLGWSAVYALRAGVQAFLYREDLPGLLAAGKLLLGWPLTIAAVALTLAAVRRATHPRRATPGPPAGPRSRTQEGSGHRDQMVAAVGSRRLDATRARDVGPHRGINSLPIVKACLENRLR